MHRLPEQVPDWMCSPKKLEHLYFETLGSVVRDKVTSRNRYTDELHDMTVDIIEIANSIRRYQESGDTERAKELEQTSRSKAQEQGRTPESQQGD